MASLQERCRAAIIGAAAADAAGQPIHWNYNQETLNKILHRYGNPEFIRPSQNPFYDIDTGKQTCYGDQAYAVLKALVLGNGFNKEYLVREMYEILGPASAYETEPVNSYYVDKTTQKLTLPISAPWRNVSIKDFLKKVDDGESETGSDNDIQIDAVTRIAPVVALYAGRKDMLNKVEEMIRVTQNNDIPVAFALAAARILEYYILNGSKPDVIEQVIKDLKNPQRLNPTDLDISMVSHFRKVLDASSMDHTAAAAQFGRN